MKLIISAVLAVTAGAGLALALAAGAAAVGHLTSEQAR